MAETKEKHITSDGCATQCLSIQEDIPQSNEMVNIWELDGINSEDRQHFEKEVASGLHHYVLLEFADGTTKYVKTKIHGGDGNMRVPSSARLVSRQDNRVASIPAVSGG